MDGLELVKESWFVRGATNALSGDAKNEAIQKQALEAAGFDWNHLVLCKQVHGDRIEIVHDAAAKIFQKTDGLITDRPGIVLGIFTADCVPVFAVESVQRVVALFHAGWRGTVKGIVKKGITMIGKEISNVKVHIGPHIRDCCYEVQSDVATQFPQSSIRTADGRQFLSLEKAIRLQLEECGVPSDCVSIDPACTSCDRKFYSFRRDRNQHRMLSFIGSL